MWGGATFDTSMRFLKESPWQRLDRPAREDPEHPVPDAAAGLERRRLHELSRQRRARRSSRKRPQAGIDVFRIFDALNWVPNMQVAMEAVHQDRRASARRPSATPATSSIPSGTKYDLKYYVELAKELEKMGAHILAIKDMAGLCKPYAAELLVKTLKQEIGIPIHFHTHDTGGMQAASILEGGRSGLDIADGAMAPMSGGTSQPNLNTIVEALRFTPRDTGLDAEQLDAIAEYWRSGPRVLHAVRKRHARRRPPTSTATRCPAGSTPTCTSRPGRSAWPIAGRRSAASTPR